MRIIHGNLRYMDFLYNAGLLTNACHAFECKCKCFTSGKCECKCHFPGMHANANVLGSHSNADVLVTDLQMHLN